MSRLAAPIPLTEEHVVAGFDSGQASLDEFLQKHALGKQRAMLSRTYVTTRENKVVGYYTLAFVTLSSAEAPRRMGRGMPDSMPGLLLARLAVVRQEQGSGVGRSLLMDALRRAWEVMAHGHAPVRVLAVDAIDESAARFYTRFDMTPSPVNPLRLYLFYRTLESLFTVSTSNPNSAIESR